MNIIIITGASSGMGREFALQLDKGLFNIDAFWLIARRQDRLLELSKKLDHPVRIFAMDLCDPDALDAFQKTLQQEQPLIRMLINSAGFGLMGSVTDLEIKGQTGQIDVNCKSLVAMTGLCLPYMPPKSRIIQLASSAAFLPQADFAVYAATKSFVLSFSMALGQELKDRQIYVTAVCPGPVKTEFFETAEQFGKTLAIKKLTMLEADTVVRQALLASSRKKSICVPGIPIKMLHGATKLFPHSWMLALCSLLKKHNSSVS